MSLYQPSLTIIYTISLVTIAVVTRDRAAAPQIVATHVAAVTRAIAVTVVTVVMVVMVVMVGMVVMVVMVVIAVAVAVAKNKWQCLKSSQSSLLLKCRLTALIRLH